MSETPHRVALTANFLQRLESIEALLHEAEEACPRAAEALAQFAALAAGAAAKLRENLHWDCLLLYTSMDANSKVGPRFTCCLSGTIGNCL